MAAKQICVPDIGNFKGVNVIEVLVKVGDVIKVEDSLITLETDKAAMDVPSPFAGAVKQVMVKAGDKISQGSVIALIETGGDAAVDTHAAEIPPTPPFAKGGTVSPLTTADSVQATSTPPTAPIASPSITPPFAPARSTPVGAPLLHSDPSAAKGGQGLPAGQAGEISAHASPSIRCLARELGVNLPEVNSSGKKGRITREDIQNFVKAALAQPRGNGRLQVAELPVVDFSSFGAIENKPLSRIKKLSGANLHRNWVSIPHVTQFDEADITDMEAFRTQLVTEYAAQGVKITLLAFLLRAVTEALQKFPDFNASLIADGETLVLKKYFHIGVAVDTSDGLVVPVLRDVNQKGIVQLAKELADIAGRARDRKITANDMQGGCFTISSLGGIGGTAFTPIINAPEVAILGVSRSSMKPVYQKGKFVPRLMLPLSLSYDHRVIDGAAAARFTSYLANLLVDVRRLAL